MPPAQVEAAFGGAAQRTPQAPQFATSVMRLARDASQPLATAPSQSLKSALQVTRHAPIAHEADALGPARQIDPHAPQFESDELRFVSQPLAALPSQSPKPAAQTKVQVSPAPHAAEAALAGIVHGVEVTRKPSLEQVCRAEEPIGQVTMLGTHTHEAHIVPTQVELAGQVEVLRAVPSALQMRTVEGDTQVDELGTHARLVHRPL